MNYLIPLYTFVLGITVGALLQYTFGEPLLPACPEATQQVTYPDHTQVCFLPHRESGSHSSTKSHQSI